MASCAVRACGSRYSVDMKKSSGITFHKFPKEIARREAWVKFVKRKRWEPTKHSVLCSKHFSEACFDRSSQCCVRLRDDAVPTLNQEDVPIHSKILSNLSNSDDKTYIKCEIKCEPEPSTSSECRFMTQEVELLDRTDVLSLPTLSKIKQELEQE